MTDDTTADTSRHDPLLALGLCPECAMPVEIPPGGGFHCRTHTLAWVLLAALDIVVPTTAGEGHHNPRTPSSAE